jgi:FAD:protein FMN transferase
MKHASIPLLLVAVVSCRASSSRYEETFVAMGTVLRIVLYVQDSHQGDAVLSKLKAESVRIERLLGAFGSDSEVRRINERGDRRKIVAAPEVADLVRLSLEYSGQTQGAFDITVAPVKWLWGFGTGLTPHKPPEDSIRAALRHVDYRRLWTRGDTLCFADAGMEIDLGGIAKGYALARLEQIVRAAGIRAYLIDAGGDVVVGGRKPGNHDWAIGIRHPRRHEDLVRTLRIADAAVITSGDYEQFFIEDSIRYHHIFDPRTGYPARGIISSTVVCDDPVRGVVYSKALLIGGRAAAQVPPPGVRQFVLVDEAMDVIAWPPEVGP